MLVLGEPDPSLFVVLLDYAETKPSDAMVKATLAADLLLPEVDGQLIVREGDQADKRYRAGDVIQELSPRRPLAPGPFERDPPKVTKAG